jgi:hypothetical protein
MCQQRGEQHAIGEVVMSSWCMVYAVPTAARHFSLQAANLIDHAGDIRQFNFAAIQKRERIDVDIGFRRGRELVGRRGGKSLILSAIAVYLAAFVNWRKYLVGGERATIVVIAADRFGPRRRSACRPSPPPFAAWQYRGHGRQAGIRQTSFLSRPLRLAARSPSGRRHI